MTWNPADMTGFWRAAGSAAWFRKDAAFDDELRSRFLETHMAAARGELVHWRDNAEGALALVLLLDQVPRNIFRGTAHMFATDPLALQTADKAISSGFDRTIGAELQVFFYLPFEHSERAHHQMRSVALFEATGNADNIKWAKLHADIIARFGRFPHRNAVLGRESTATEVAFLNEGGFSG